MLPVPSPIAKQLFTCAVCLVLLGIAFQSVLPVCFASVIFIGLGAALALTTPLGRRARRQRLEFAWWLELGPESKSGGAVVPDSPFDVRCFVRHTGRSSLLVTQLKPVVDECVQLLDQEDQPLQDESADSLTVSPGFRTEFRFRCIAPAAGRVVLHGLAVQLVGTFGLFYLPLYFPNPLAIRVLPRATVRTRHRRRPNRLTATRSGQTHVRVRGGGTELHELRELVPGDPFKSIAWKASARYGKLLVKEVEQEIQQTRWVIMDISSSMRSGTLGERRLDYAIEACASESRIAIDAGDRVGLINIDNRIVSALLPRDGRAHLLKIYNGLLAATEIVDSDLTEATDAQVLRIAARYVRQQDGIDFVSRRSGNIDVSALSRHLQRSLSSLPKANEMPKGESPEGQLARYYCQARGIPLRYRADTHSSTGLQDALGFILSQGRSPTHIMCVTDFGADEELTELTATLKMARARGHTITIFAPPNEYTEQDTLSIIYRRAKSRQVETVTRHLASLGVTVLHPTPAPKAPL